MGDSQQAHQDVFGDQPSHHSSWTHEVVAGAAGFEGNIHIIFDLSEIISIYLALRAYENHCRETGEQVSHPVMKEMLAGFAAAEVDKLFETKGLDTLDREEAKRRAVHQAHQLAEEKYGSGGTFQA